MCLFCPHHDVVLPAAGRAADAQTPEIQSLGQAAAWQSRADLCPMVMSHQRSRHCPPCVGSLLPSMVPGPSTLHAQCQSAGCITAQDTSSVAEQLLANSETVLWSQAPSCLSLNAKLCPQQRDFDNSNSFRNRVFVPLSLHVQCYQVVEKLACSWPIMA